MSDGFSKRDAVAIITGAAALFTGGTLGFMWILGESWDAALYRTIVSASLTGLDSTPHGLKAEALTILIVLSGVALFGYFAAQLFDEIAHGILGGGRRARKRQRMIDQLRDHIIVCGYGRVGRRAAEEFRANNVPYVVLDYSGDATDAAEREGALFIRGNGANDDDLIRAGLDRARGLIVASDDDADNLYITLSAKARRPDITVIARGSSADAERKLKLAGADRVVTPYTTAGRVMANLMTKPQVSAFVSALTSADDEPHLSFEEITVLDTCKATGHTIGDLDVQTKTGAYIVAIRKPDGTLEVRPSKDTQIETGDVVLGLGAPDEVARLEELFAP
ncbi:MAG TPA: NAD-binding protein [Gaiellaceae bacterium]|nr:NAD-binding protein [Gaiellaceae bacterium]